MKIRHRSKVKKLREALPHGSRLFPKVLAAVGLALLGVTLTTEAGQGPQPSICNRSCWGARNSSCSSMSSLNRAIIHHTAGASDWTTDYETGKAKVRGVQNLHMDGNGWCDIAYHFCINAGGHIYEGRKNSMTGLPRGAHDGCNANSFGFNVLGYYHSPYNHTFTSAARSSLEAVIAWRMPSSWSATGSGTYCGNSVGTLDGHYKVKSTACPGDGIIPSIPGIRTGVMNRKNGTTPPPPSTVRAKAFNADFDGDGKSDFATWRPSDGQWSIAKSSTGASWYSTWGANGDIPVPADYDGDGITDRAIWDPSSGQWAVAKSSTGASWYFTWGTSGDIPVPADYDGDGKADFATWRPSNGQWSIAKSSNGASWYSNWGANGDVPIPADYDGDGIADRTTWRPSNGQWSVAKSSNGASWYFTWGTNGDIPVPGDYDGDGTADFTTWRPSDGQWSIAKSSNGASWYSNWGTNGDIPVSGNYDGDTMTDRTTWRPSNGQWSVAKSSNGASWYFTWGTTGHIPLP